MSEGGTYFITTDKRSSAKHKQSSNTVGVEVNLVFWSIVEYSVEGERLLNEVSHIWFFINIPKVKLKTDSN